MSDGPFIDTNILVYAHDIDAGAKHEKAAKLIVQMWSEAAAPVISVQVLQELHVNLVRKGVPMNQSVATVRNYLSWRVIDNDKGLFNESLDAQRRWQLSLWDALIVTAASRAGVSELWSEDFTHRQKFGGVTVINPLKS